jgi:hypothetical protein
MQWQGVSLEDLPLDTVRTQLSWFDKVFHYLDLASQTEECRWEHPVREEGFRSEMPDLASFRTLARLLVLKARLTLMDGDINAALQTIRIGITMGRQVGQGPFVVQHIVGVSLAHRMTLEIERMIQMVDSPNLYWALTALPHPLVDMRPALQMERDAVYTELPELRRLDRQVLSDDEVIDVWNRALALSQLADGRPSKWMARLDMVTHAMKAYPQAKQFLEGQGKTDEEVDALPALYVVLRYQYHHYRQLRDNIYKWYHLPYWQAKEGLIPAVVRPELDKALSGNAALQVALIPNINTRRILEATLPTLLNQRLQIQGNALTKGLQWASLAVAVSPQQKLTLHVQSADTHSALAFKKLLSALWAIVEQIPDLQKASPNLRTTLDTLVPHADNSRLQLTLDDTQCTRLGTDLLGPGLLAIRRRIERHTCSINLSGMGKAIIIYANDFDDQFPPDLETLIRTVELSPKGLRCSGRKKAGDSYVYRGVDLGGQNGNQDLILVHDKADNHTHGRNVLFVDDRVKWVTEPQFQELIKRDNLLRRQRQLPEKAAQ